MKRTTALLHGRLIDGTGSSPLDDAGLVIEGDTIVEAAAASDIAPRSDWQTIDVRGHTLLPGLLDGHMHVTGMPGLLDNTGHLRQSMRAIARLQRCLQWGTTTVANTGGGFQNTLVRQALGDDGIRGCARLVVGGMVNATGGHVRGLDADGPWAVRRAVRELVRDGVDYIKTAASGGFQWENEQIDTEDYTPEELEALVHETHARGRRVHVHAHAQPGLSRAIQAGCDVILHGAMIDEAALQEMSARREKLWYMPTLYITSEPVWRNPARPPHMRERMEQAHPVHRAGVRRAHELGLRIALGTDGGPGAAMQELVELVHCGLTPMEAIVAGTRTTATCLDLQHRLGTLTPGLQADVLVVRGDPLKRIEMLTERDRIALVLCDGRPAYSETLAGVVPGTGEVGKGKSRDGQR